MIQFKRKIWEHFIPISFMHKNLLNYCEKQYLEFQQEMIILYLIDVQELAF